MSMTMSLTIVMLWCHHEHKHEHEHEHEHQHEHEHEHDHHDESDHCYALAPIDPPLLAPSTCSPSTGSGRIGQLGMLKKRKNDFPGNGKKNQD